MKRLAFASIAVVLILSACVDERDARITTAPTPPRVLFNAQTGAGTSTVCTGYGKDLTAARAELQAAPEAADIQAKVASLDAMIADACR